jgi:hypothetical protein
MRWPFPVTPFSSGYKNVSMGSVRSGVAAMQRPWPLAKGSGCILCQGISVAFIQVTPLGHVAPWEWN